MEIKNRWMVLECPKCKDRGYYYLGSAIAPDDMDKLEYAGFSKEETLCDRCHSDQIEIPYEQWHTKDIAEIFGNELEDRNHHWLTSMPQHLCEALQKANVPIDMQANVMRYFMEEMSKKW